jgi:hypothetical protein
LDMYVIPAKAGIQLWPLVLVDSRFRGNDEAWETVEG